MHVCAFCIVGQSSQDVMCASISMRVAGVRNVTTASKTSQVGSFMAVELLHTLNAYMMWR